MKRIKVGLVGIGLLCLLIWLPNTASARTSFYLSIGSHHPRFHLHRGSRRHRPLFRRHRPLSRHHRFHRRAPYRRFHIVHRGYYYWPRPIYSSGVSIWTNDWYTRVIGAPVTCGRAIVEVPKVIVEREMVVKTGEYDCRIEYDEKTAELFEQLRQEKSELLKKLKEGDKEKRKEAIDKLAGFSFDEEVREALEKILLSDPDPELRKQVAKSFGKTKNRKALSILEKVRIEDSNEGVRKEADKAVKKIKGY